MNFRPSKAKVNSDCDESRNKPQLISAAKDPPVERLARHCFTLIELFVVVGVIGLLAALLVPALVRAKRAACRIQCTNNQRQLALVWALYSADHNDLLPANGVGDPPSQKQRFWIKGALYHPEANTNAALITDPQYALFAEYLPSTRVYVCPADPPAVTVFDASFPRLRSYALNAYLGWVGRLDFRLSDKYTIFSRYSQLAAGRPPEIFLYQDVHPKSICWPYFGVQMDWDMFFNFPNSSHGGGAVVSFADLHIEHHRWQDERTLEAQSPDYHLHMDSSPGNSDLAWLRQHTTLPTPFR